METGSSARQTAAKTAKEATTATTANGDGNGCLTPGPSPAIPPVGRDNLGRGENGGNNNAASIVGQTPSSVRSVGIALARAHRLARDAKHVLQPDSSVVAATVNRVGLGRPTYGNG